MWFARCTIEDIKPFIKGNLCENLGIELTELGEDFLKAKMPVDHRTKQATGILHGGASVALAETLGSIASSLCVDFSKSYCVGLEINANHIRSVSDGYVYGTARPLHVGKSTHIWEIKIENQQGKLTCISRITMAVIERKTINKNK